MRRAWCGVLCGWLALGGSGDARGQQATHALAISNVDVLDVVAGRIVAGQTAVIDDGRIVAVQPRRQAVRARQVVDGRGKTLMPGLLDMHAHVRANGLPEWVSTEWLLPLMLAHGVTGVRDMNSACDGPKDGPVCLESLLQWRAEIDSGQRLAPRLLALSSWPVDPPWTYDLKEAQARSLVRTFKAQGLDSVKTYNRLSSPGLRWMLDESRLVGLKVAGHVPLRVSTVEASNAGMASIEHARDLLFDCYPGGSTFRATTMSAQPSMSDMKAMVDQHDEARCRAAIAVLASNRTALVPTHVTRRMEARAHDAAFRSDLRLDTLPTWLRDDWIRDADRVVALDASPEGRRVFEAFYRKGLALTGAAHAAGVRVLVGTDSADSFSFPGSGYHDELEELARAGLSHAAVLRAATVSAAEFLGVSEALGRVAVGHRADLLLLDGNPLEDLKWTRRIHAVVLGGRVMDRTQLRQMQDAAHAAAKRPLEAAR